MRWGRELPTVLVVDDMTDHLALYEHRLGSEYDVLTATDGETALEAVSEDVDVVLLDRALSGTSGDDVLARIRDAGFDCRVAMVTADDPDEDVVDLGYDASLTKPVSETELVTVVERLLRLAAYVEAVDDYHEACKRRAKRQRASEEEAGLADGGLDEQLREHRERVDALAADFDAADYRVVFRDLQDQH